MGRMGIAVAVVGFTLVLVVGLTGEARAEVPAPILTPESVGIVDVDQGYWWLRDAGTGGTTAFYFGNPGDTPFTGDWDCNGVDTPGLYRRSDGYVYLRNTNTQGIADVSFFFGNPGDVPLSGDFNGDGCDTVSLFRPENGRFYVINRLGSADTGLGAADVDYSFGDSGDVPFVGDFDGDGVDTFGTRREVSGHVFLKNSHTFGPADESLLFGDRGDTVVAGDWNADGGSTVGLYRDANTHFYLRFDNTAGPANDTFMYGVHGGVPISGAWGPLPGGSAAPMVMPRLVSQFTTFHPCCQNRNINIDLIADTVDGAVVLPGEVFSLNDLVGQRTAAKGYVPAGAIIGGIVYCCDNPINIGGGTSQFATTLYNAAYLGAYEDVYHRPHSLYFNRYPAGREATLSYPGPDVQFRNDTVFPMTIRTEHTSKSVTVKIYGDNEGRTVSSQTIADVSPKDGGKATVYRTIEYANGTYTVQRWVHTYRPVID
jgi:hypothetical protein